MMKTWKILAAIVFCASSFSGVTQAGAAAPEAAGKPQDRFMMMDADKNGTVNWKEFEASMPQMRREAFDKIDTDKNGELSRAEWDGFKASHGMGGKGMGGMPGGMPENMGGKPGEAQPKMMEKPGIMPPSAQKPSESRPGIMPPANESN